MDFIKKNYEKVALSVVLLAVAVVAFWLTQKAGQERADLDTALQQRASGKQKLLGPVDLTNSVVALSGLSQPFELMLEGEHNTFNPVPWIKTGSILKPVPRRPGQGVVSVSRIVPLKLNVTYIGVAGTGDPYRYQFTIEREYEKTLSKRRPLTGSLTEGNKNDLFLLREIRGNPSSAGEVVVELLDTGERVTLTKDKTYSKVMAYAADLRHDLGNRDYPGKRQDDALNLGGSIYKVISIGPEEVIIQAPNKTRSTIRPDSGSSN